MDTPERDTFLRPHFAKRFLPLVEELLSFAGSLVDDSEVIGVVMIERIHSSVVR